MSNFGTQEIIIIALILFLLFGGRKLPEFGRGLGESFKELKKALRGEETGKTKKNKGED